MSQHQIAIDLYSDFASNCAAALVSAGYIAPTGSTEEIIRAYVNVRHRRVPVKPRKVYKATYTVPAALAAGESAFLSKVGAGDDLRPYQSTRLERVDFNDGMLNDFGIQHFHLGMAPHPTKPGFIERTDPVLFAMVRDNDFYSLGCYHHGDWSRTVALDIIHTNWPDVLEPYAIKNVQLTQTYTDEEIERMRKAGINVLTQRPDGTVHVGPGGGVTTAKTSGQVARDMAAIRRLCNKLERSLTADINSLIAAGTLSAPVSVKLEQRQDRTYAVVGGGQYQSDLNQQLLVPPL